MAESNGAAIGIDLINVEAGLAYDSEGLDGERLIQFDDADFVELASAQLQCFRNCDDRTNAHNLRGNAAGGEAYEASLGSETKLLGFFRGHDQGGCGAVAGLRGVAGRNAALKPEDRFQ